MSRHRLSKYFPAFFITLDIVWLNISFYSANYVAFGSYHNLSGYLLLQLFLNLSWLLIFFSSGLHDINREKGLIVNLNKVLFSIIINLSIVFAFWFFARSEVYSRQHLFYFFLAFSSSIISWRILWHFFIRYSRTKGYNVRNFVVVGDGEIATELVEHFRFNPGIGYRFLHTFNSKDHGLVDSVREFSRSNIVDVIFCNLQSLSEVEVKNLVDYAENHLIKIKLVSQFIKLGNRDLSIQKYGEIPVININAIPLDSWVNQTIKRAFDIIFSSLVILFLLSWLYPIIAFFIKYENSGPVIFKQVRNGKRNQRFYCWKFRTMILNPDAEDKQATKGDARITRVGAILRRTSLDELPQFINVFLGEMSVVGPRPHPIKLNEQFQPKIDRFIQRHAVKPGITGLAQAKGFRGETSIFSDMSGRVRLDRFYVKNWSLILDFKIIVLTVISILKGSENAY